MNRQRSSALAAAFAVSLAGCQAKHVPPASDLKMSDSSSAKQLISGFHHVESNRWRWTARRFAVVLAPPPGSRRAGARLRLQLYIPDSLIQKLGPITLSADAGEVSLAPETFSKPGSFAYSRDIPSVLLRPPLVLPVVFSFDKALSPSEGDGRELAAVVTEVALERNN